MKPGGNYSVTNTLFRIMKDLIGYMAVLFTVMSFVPQVYRTIMTKSVRDISIYTLITFVCASSSWIIYGVMRSDVPIVTTNLFTLSLQIVLLVLKIKYDRSPDFVKR